MRKTLALTGALGALTLLSACGSSGIFDRERPDEFAVSRAAPLAVPPDFALVPPQPGAAPTQGGSNQEEVLEALFGGPAPRSAAESAIIGAAGDAELGIRTAVGDPETKTLNKGSVTRDIIAAPEGDGQNAQAAIPGA